MPIGVSGLVNDSPCDSSSTKVGILVAITGHNPTSPVLTTYYHWRRVPRPPPLLYPPGKRDPAYLSRGFSSTNLWCPQWDS
ncbi:hypothetical protein AVEN_24734-1 [Araneus ventricosus]|uniref:Uncharacterized protein n=1 Tax=Araneus ventricosus TaxID=182803 RepID=A0A4Y2SDF3_ARAVE|nr:hypothetical protein AVEN_15649-1 [Araneus ventricosus]GBN86267.1 hypothetical protein AVEN_24734-1 [Araneus ventricosus]